MAMSALAEDRGMEHGVRVEIDVAAAEVLGERSQAALYEIVREAFEGAIRRGPPTLFSVHAAQAAPDSVEVTIHDDAPSERRRRSIEVLEERARTLGAALSVAYDDDGTTMRLQLPTYAASD
jgi:nitrate/nitrite-specific signal transduction histidine kinase